MARLSVNWWSGIVCELDHEETLGISDAEDKASTLLNTFGKVTGPFALALDAIAAYISVNSAITKAVDHGNGVYLTLSWPALYIGQFWLIIPTPR